MTPKIHVACDGVGRVLAFVLTGGNVHDCTRFARVMDTISVHRRACAPQLDAAGLPRHADTPPLAAPTGDRHATADRRLLPLTPACP
ncbi:transposase [Actinoplanes sp. NPDC051343]|uniref:transposase n=1 Tax=Actinoplanes sp. NPDC051343 TaxID=3363906 RepID=UPI0037A89D02